MRLHLTGYCALVRQAPPDITAPHRTARAGPSRLGAGPPPVASPDVPTRGDVVVRGHHLLADAPTVCDDFVVSPNARMPMTFQHAEHLCRELMGADTSDAAVAALRQAGYWDDPRAWRPLGDNPGNLSTVANQQSDPVAALAEKLTNAVDARLINACWATGANPQDPDGPNSPRAAVARFIDRKSPEAGEKYGGDVWDWPNRARIGHAEKITVAVTGGADKSPACVSVADAGEGQSPSMFAETLCSLTSSNKDRIPFARGPIPTWGVRGLCGSAARSIFS